MQNIDAKIIESMSDQVTKIEELIHEQFRLVSTEEKRKLYRRAWQACVTMRNIIDKLQKEKGL